MAEQNYGVRYSFLGSQNFSRCNGALGPPGTAAIEVFFFTGGALGICWLDMETASKAADELFRRS